MAERIRGWPGSRAGNTASTKGTNNHMQHPKPYLQHPSHTCITYPGTSRNVFPNHWGSSQVNRVDPGKLGHHSMWYVWRFLLTIRSRVQVSVLLLCLFMTSKFFSSIYWKDFLFLTESSLSNTNYYMYESNSNMQFVLFIYVSVFMTTPHCHDY